MKKNTGFTLIEVILYSALVALILSGLLIPLSTIVASAGRTTKEGIAREESSFLFTQLKHVLEEHPGILFPAVGATSTVLIGGDPGNEVTFMVENFKVIYKEHGSATSTLGDTSFPVTSILFYHASSSIRAMQELRVGIMPYGQHTLYEKTFITP